MTGDTSDRPLTAELGIPGRLAIGLVVLAGLVVAVSTALGLVLYIAYAGIGAILIVRRPRTSIGWLLLGLAWAQAIATFPIDGSPQQFADGSLPLSTRVAASLQSASVVTIFLAWATLVTVFPSGRLPSGRWGRTARVLLVLAVLSTALYAFSPNIQVNLSGYANDPFVPNPFAVLPGLPVWQWLTPDNLFAVIFLVLVITTLSLVVRVRRSEGVERQQLRWIGAAFGFFAVAFVAGLLISSLVPGTLESGLAFLLVPVAAMTVPIAIGIAVHRYRLYEIDTIINRAIVYGLLTAILAGGSAAMIGLTQRLFEGIIGPGSDANIVLTTLLVVTAFNPVKGRLERIVDRRFKEVHSPAALLDAFVAEVHRSISTPDTDRSLRRLLEVAVRAYRASGGELHVESKRGGRRSFQAGTVTSAPGLSASASSGALRAEILLSGGDLSRESAVLQPALASVLDATSASG